MPRRLLLGAHVSIAGGLPLAFDRAEALGCGAMQIFVKNAAQWAGRVLGDEEAAAFRARRERSSVGPVVAHASYLVNLAAGDATLLARSRAALEDELRRCQRLGVDALIVHPGAHLGAGEEEGIRRVAASLDAVCAGTPECPTRVLLENTSGQGTCLGHRLEHLQAVREKLRFPERVGVCLDTCHAFSAGYAVHRPRGYERFWREVEARLGMATVGCLHLNDSLRPFAARRDRHAHIGEGEIGLELFGRLLADRRLRRLPMVVETEPEQDAAGHRRDLERLRRLAAARRTSPTTRSARAPAPSAPRRRPARSA